MNPQASTPQANPDMSPHRAEVDAAFDQALPAMDNSEHNLQTGELPQVTPPPDPAAIAQLAQQAAAPTIPPPVSVAATEDQPLSSYSPAIADDSDLIEPEWVQRAKKIVQDTHDDPHRQNQEVNRLKADYIKKRYKKEIKVAEG